MNACNLDEKQEINKQRRGRKHSLPGCLLQWMQSHSSGRKEFIQVKEYVWKYKAIGSVGKLVKGYVECRNEWNQKRT